MFISVVSVYSVFMLVVYSSLLWVQKSPFKKVYRLLVLVFSLLAALNLLMLLLYYAHSHNMYFLLSWFFPLLCMVPHGNDDQFCYGTIVIAVLVIFVSLQSHIFNGLSLHHWVEIPVKSSRGPKLDEKRINDYRQKLLYLLEHDKIYLHPNCSQDTVVIQTNIPKHHLSSVINSEFNKSFTDLINEYRCKHAHALLESEYTQRLTIEAIGKLSGFGSRVNFSNAFKKVYGISPSDHPAGLHRNNK